MIYVKNFILKPFLALFCSFVISFKVNGVGQYKTVEYNDGTKVFYVSTEKIEETLNLIDDIISARDFAQSSWILGALLSVPSLLSSELLSKLFPKLKNWKLVIGLSGPAMLAVLPSVVNYFREEEANSFADCVHLTRAYSIMSEYVAIKRSLKKSSDYNDYISKDKYFRDQKFVNDIEKGNSIVCILFPTKKYQTYRQNLNENLGNLAYQGFTTQSSMPERYEKDLEEHCGGIKKVYDNEIHFN